MTVTVYSTPDCVQCKQTYKELEKRGVAFQVVDLAADDAAMARVRGLGFSRAPVVEAGSEFWSGFRPDKIKALAA